MIWSITKWNSLYNRMTSSRYNNFALHAAKMNTHVYYLLPDPEADDLPMCHHASLLSVYLLKFKFTDQILVTYPKYIFFLQSSRWVKAFSFLPSIIKQDFMTCLSHLQDFLFYPYYSQTHYGAKLTNLCTFKKARVIFG